jgi:hypothetical protein
MPGEPKTRSKTRKQQPGRNGGTLNVGGYHNGGRPPDEFKRRMREIASSDEALAYLTDCAKGLHGPKAAASAQAYASERGYGKEPSVTKITGDDSAPLTIRVVRE